MRNSPSRWFIAAIAVVGIASASACAQIPAELTCAEDRSALTSIGGGQIEVDDDGRLVGLLTTGVKGRLDDVDLSPLSKLTGMKRLSISELETGPAWVEHIAGLTRLESLSTFRTGVQDRDLKHLARLTKLRKLYFEIEFLSDAAIKEIVKLPELEDLYLRKASITDAGLARLGGMPKLKRLVVTGSKITPQGIAQLADSKIEEFRSDCATNQTQLPYLKLLKNLKTLGLGTQGITDDDLKHIGEMKSLESLNLSYNHVTDAGVKKLAGLAQLRELNLTRAQKGSRNAEPVTSLTDRSLQTIAKFTELRRLELTGAEISAKGIEQLHALKNLEFLEITDTPLESAERVDLRGCTGLKVVSAYDFDETRLLVPEGCNVVTFD